MLNIACCSHRISESTGDFDNTYGILTAKCFRNFGQFEPVVLLPKKMITQALNLQVMLFTVFLKTNKSMKKSLSSFGKITLYPSIPQRHWQDINNRYES